MTEAKGEKISTQQFPGFVGALANFDTCVRNISYGFGQELGVLGLDMLFNFPQDPNVDINAALNVSSRKLGFETLPHLYEMASRSFTQLTEIFPNLIYGKIFRSRGYTLREQDSSGRFSREVIGFSPYSVLRYTLRENMVEFPEEFETAYEALTTGTWRGVRIVEEDYSSTPGVSNLSSPYFNIIRVTEGSEPDEAFSFLSGLGFFQRQVSIPSTNVKYLLGGRGVSLEKMSGRDEYLSPSTNSVFGRYCTDQELLETLLDARARNLRAKLS